MTCNTCENEIVGIVYGIVKHEIVRLIPGFKEGTTCEKCALNYLNKYNGTHLTEMPEAMIWKQKI